MRIKKVVLFCKQEKEAQCLTTGELTLRFRRHRKAPGSALGSQERSAAGGRTACCGGGGWSFTSRLLPAGASETRSGGE